MDNGLVDFYLLGSIILLLIFPIELPVQINSQAGGPGVYFARPLHTDLLGMI